MSDAADGAGYDHDGRDVRDVNTAGVVFVVVVATVPATRRAVHSLSSCELARSYASRATTINDSPITNAANMSARRGDVPGGAVLNSFQMKTPHHAATRVAPCPNP